MPLIRPKQVGLSIDLNVTLWLFRDLRRTKPEHPLSAP